MKYLTIYFLLLSLSTFSHPGTGLVKDSKGIIYYTDLENVWKINNSVRSIVVAGVHTHELYIDADDNLYGENETYDGDRAGTFRHYLWVLRPNGKLDTIVQPTQAYVNIDFSLFRDQNRNEYYIKNFITRPDTAHIFKRMPDGTETIFVKGNFKNVKLLHPQTDGSVLYILNNDLYRATEGKSILVAKNVALGEHPQTFGVWQDTSSNIYVADFNDRSIIRISTAGEKTIFYRSSGNWKPLHGVFDNDGRLWVLETDPANKVRVVSSEQKAREEKLKRPVNWMIAAFIIVVAFVIVLLVRRR